MDRTVSPISLLTRATRVALVLRPTGISRITAAVAIIILLCACGGGAPDSRSSFRAPLANDHQPMAEQQRTMDDTRQPDPNGVDLLSLEYDLADLDSTVRLDAVEQLGSIDSDDAVRALERALLDANPAVRAAALSELTDIPGDASAHAIAIALWSDDVETRVDAVDALAHVGGPVAMGLLQQSLSDEDVYVRELAARHLARMY